MRTSENLPDRISEQNVTDSIVGAEYHVFDGRHTVCCLKLRNGFTVLGESACVDAANFDRDKGEQMACKDATEKVWPLLGFMLAEGLYEARQKFADAAGG